MTYSGIATPSATPDPVSAPRTLRTASGRSDTPGWKSPVKCSSHQRDRAAPEAGGTAGQDHRAGSVAQSGRPGPHNRFGPARHAHLGEDVRDVVPDGVGGQLEARGDGAVGQAARDQSEDLALARRE